MYSVAHVERASLMLMSVTSEFNNLDIGMHFSYLYIVYIVLIQILVKVTHIPHAGRKLHERPTKNFG